MILGELGPRAAVADPGPQRDQLMTLKPIKELPGPGPGTSACCSLILAVVLKPPRFSTDVVTSESSRDKPCLASVGEAPRRFQAVANGFGHQEVPEYP